MADEWRRVRFSELCDITRGGSPRPIHEWIAPAGIPWVKIADASSANSRFIERTAEFIYPEGRSKSRSVVPGDLILSNSASPGMPMFMAIDACIHDGWLLLRNFRGIDKLFCYYLLLFEKDRIVRQGTGTVFTNLKTEILKNHEVTIPSLEQQEAIAHILGALDDKIELNRRMNETFEAIAGAIFKSWFVDFDPVRAKMEDHQPAGMDAETAELFSDSFTNSELGTIPDGWKVKEICECCSKIQNGGTPRRSDSECWNPGTIPWLTSGEVRQTLITKTESMISELGLKRSSAKWLPKDSTVVALYGATAGQVALISSEMTTNQAVCGLIPKASFRYFNYMSLNRSVGTLANLARGSAQQNISKGIVETTKVIMPGTDILEAFDRLMSPIFENWVANLEESSTLAALRDALLPKLISGEIRVRDAERFVEEHAG